MLRQILNKIPLTRRLKKCRPSALAFPTTTKYDSDYAFQSRRDSVARGNNHEGVEL